MAARKLYIRTRIAGKPNLQGIVYRELDADGAPTGRGIHAKPGDEVPRHVVRDKKDPIMALLTNTKPKAPPPQPSALLDD